jgi:hypothetical protein
MASNGGVSKGVCQAASSGLAGADCGVSSISDALHIGSGWVVQIYHPEGFFGPFVLAASALFREIAASNQDHDR